MKFKRSILAVALSAGMVLGGGFVNESLSTVVHAEYQGDSLDKIMEVINNSKEEIGKFSKEKKEEEERVESSRMEYKKRQEEYDALNKKASNPPTNEELSALNELNRILEEIEYDIELRQVVVDAIEMQISTAKFDLREGAIRLKEYQDYLNKEKDKLVSEIKASKIKDSEKERLINNTKQAINLESISVIKDSLKELTGSPSLPKDDSKEKPDEPKWLADRKDLITKIKASKLSEVHKEALIASANASQNEKQFNEVKLRFEKAVKDMTSTPDIAKEKDSLIKKIKESKLSDSKKLDLITEVASTSTSEELKTIEEKFNKEVKDLGKELEKAKEELIKKIKDSKLDESKKLKLEKEANNAIVISELDLIEDKFDKAVKDLNEKDDSKKPSKTQLAKLEKAIEDAKITLKAVEFLKKYAPNKIENVREILDLLVIEQQERIELAEDIISKAK